MDGVFVSVVYFVFYGWCVRVRGVFCFLWVVCSCSWCVLFSMGGVFVFVVCFVFYGWCVRVRDVFCFLLVVCSCSWCVLFSVGGVLVFVVCFVFYWWCVRVGGNSHMYTVSFPFSLSNRRILKYCRYMCCKFIFFKLTSSSLA